jgi:prepilin-type N-terminal cleavage/methylation domain-containing protein
MAETPSFGVTAITDARLIPEMAVGNRAPGESLYLKAGLGKPPRRKKGFMSSRRMRGFSMIEVLVVISLILIVTAFSIMAIQPSLKAGRVTEGYNTTLMAMRQARDISVAQRQIYFVTLSNAAVPNSITITQGSTGNVTATYFLPTDVAFDAELGIPTSPLIAPTTPDGFGVGTPAIDFDQGIAAGAKNVIYFYPDGSAADVLGNVNNGVVYITRPGDINNSRAITLWGATGRLRGWHVYLNAAKYYWRQQ